MTEFHVVSLGVAVVSAGISLTAYILVGQAKREVDASAARMKAQLAVVSALRAASEIREAATSAGLPEGGILEVSPELAGILVSSPDYDAGGVDDDYGSLFIWRVSVAADIGDVRRKIHCRFSVDGRDHTICFNLV
jgi:hypothetical protein